MVMVAPDLPLYDHIFYQYARALRVRRARAQVAVRCFDQLPLRIPDAYFWGRLTGVLT
jgi:hypothetical protein